MIHALQASFLGNAGEWAHDIRGFVSNRTGLARMVAIELYNLLPPDRAVLIRRPLEKREWLLASPLPASDGALARRWNSFGVATAAAVGSDAPASRLGYYNAGFLSNLHDGGTWSGLPADQPPDDRDPYFSYMTAEAPYLPIDGEAYYGTPWPAKNRSLVDGHAAALRFAQARRFYAVLQRNSAQLSHQTDRPPVHSTTTRPSRTTTRSGRSTRSPRRSRTTNRSTSGTRRLSTSASSTITSCR